MFKRVNREIVKKYKNIFLQSKNVFEATQLTLDLIVKIKNGKFKEATEEEISLAHKEAAAERFDNFMDSKEPIKLITGSVIFLLTTGTGENKKTEEITFPYNQMNPEVIVANNILIKGYWEYDANGKFIKDNFINVSSIRRFFLHGEILKEMESGAPNQSIIEKLRAGKLRGQVGEIEFKISSNPIEEAKNKEMRDFLFGKDGRLSSLLDAAVEGFKNNLEDDTVKEYHENGQVKQEWMYKNKNGKAEGTVKTYYEYGQLEGESIFKNGELNGICKKYYKNGQLEVESTYKDGKPGGVYKLYHENGQVKEEGIYKDGIKLESKLYDMSEDLVKTNKEENQEGKWDGLYKKYYVSGKLQSEVIYKNGQPVGIVKSYFEDGKLGLEGNYKNGQPEGQWKTYYKNGNLQNLITYKEGKEEGLRKFYYKNGQLKEEGVVKNAFPEDGPLKSYYENGQLKLEMFLKDGKREGQKRAYYENGKLIVESIYKNGKMEGLSKLYYKNGQLQEEKIFKDDMRDGVAKIYNENGDVQFIYTYKDGEKIDQKINESANKEANQKDGHIKEYYVNGKMKRDVELKNGKRDGIFISCYENGEYELIDHYKEGEIIYRKAYDHDGEIFYTQNFSFSFNKIKT